MVDTASRQVFWTDSGQGRLESAAYDGSARRSLVDRGLHEPGALAVAGRHVYWVDQGAGTVERVDRETGTERVTVKTRLNDLTDIISVVRPSSDSRCVSTST